MAMLTETGTDPWVMTWKSRFESHDYEPLYLSNGTFGGVLDLSGATMDLWSGAIWGESGGSGLAGGSVCPVTALRTAVHYRNAHFREHGFWIGRSGILSDDSSYTADPSMPHMAQVYECRQELNLRAGMATTSGVLFPGTLAAWEAGVAQERAICFQTRIIFLKDSPVMAMEVESDDEILFFPAAILRERLQLGAQARGILRLGNAIECDLDVRQDVDGIDASDRRIEYRMQPRGGRPYRAVVSTPNASLHRVGGEAALLARKRATFFVEILPEGVSPTTFPCRFEELEAEQSRRWKSFWESSDVRLPEAERTWQQRYRAGLFYVAQSMGPGAVHPTGLSKPMLPYWFGCFHDTDTYFCRPLLETGHFVEAGKNLDFRHKGLQAAAGIAADHQRSGAFYPWQADPTGRGPHHEIPINSAIIACEAWHQFTHSGDSEALRKASEIVRGVLICLSGLLDGESEPLRLRPKAVMTFSETMVAEDPTEVRVALRAVAATQLAVSRLGHGDAQCDGLARRILDEVEVPVHADGRYAFSPTREPGYLRCPSITLGSFPLHHLPADQRLASTLRDELGKILFHFAWLPHQSSVVASQLELREGPLGASDMLRKADAFYKPWQAYDEWENRRSVRALNYVTGGGGFCIAVHHMLVAETGDGVWTLFAGCPEDWLDVAFEKIRTRAGWTLSARRSGGKVVCVEAAPTHPFAGAVTLRIPRASPGLMECARQAGATMHESCLSVRLTPEGSSLPIRICQP